MSNQASKIRFWIGAGVSALILIWVGIITWAFIHPLPAMDVTKPTPGTDLNLLFAPILAAAAGIERLLESMFDFIETRMRASIAFLSGRSEWFTWATSEVERMRDNLAKVAEGSKAMDPLSEAGKALQDKMESAEQLVQTAEDRLSQVSGFVEYVSTKRTMSVVVGLWLGVLVATVGSLRMFATLGVSIEPHVDVIITGLVIGTGSYPVHSLVGILQQTKDTLDGAQSYLKAKAGN